MYFFLNLFKNPALREMGFGPRRIKFEKCELDFKDHHRIIKFKKYTT